MGRKDAEQIKDEPLDVVLTVIILLTIAAGIIACLDYVWRLIAQT